jgi:hypothetical protein
MRNPRDLPHSGCVRLGIDPNQGDTISRPRHSTGRAHLTSADVRNWHDRDKELCRLEFRLQRLTGHTAKIPARPGLTHSRSFPTDDGVMICDACCERVEHALSKFAPWRNTSLTRYLDILK